MENRVNKQKPYTERRRRHSASTRGKQSSRKKSRKRAKEPTNYTRGKSPAEKRCTEGRGSYRYRERCKHTKGEENTGKYSTTNDDTHKNSEIGEERGTRHEIKLRHETSQR
ncbi:unnamed protein product [Ectocarpus sp. 12 AP-2014]